MFNLRKKIISLLAAAAMIAVLAACGVGAAEEFPQPAADVIESTAAKYASTEDAVPAYAGSEDLTIEDAVIEDTAIEAAAIAFEAYSRILDQLQASYNIDFFTVTDIISNGEAGTFIVDGNVSVTADGNTANTSLTIDLGGLIGDLLGDMFDGVVDLHMVTEGCEVTSLRLLIGGFEIPLELLALMGGLHLGDIHEMLDFDEVADRLRTVELPEIDIDSILSVEIVEADNKITINMTVNGQATLDIGLGLIEDYMPDGDFTLDDIQMTIVTDSCGNPLTVTMTMGVAAESGGKTIQVNFASEFIFNTVAEGALL